MHRLWAIVSWLVASSAIFAAAQADDGQSTEIAELTSRSSSGATTLANPATDADSADVQDLLLLGPTHPVRIRLHVDTNGVPFRTRWRKAIEESFRHFDVADSGHITAEQAGRLSVMFARSMSPGNDITPLAAPISAAMMAGKNSRQFTLDDVVAQLEQSAPPFVIRPRLSSRGAGPALFSLLDTDGDGRLSRQELSAAEQSLRCRDFDDDGLITPDELIQGPSASTAGGNPSAATAIDGPVIAVTKATAPERLVDTLLLRYDRNRDGTLSFAGPSAEIRSPTNSFAKFDADHDGALNRTELKALVAAPPDIEMSFHFGRQVATAHTTTPTNQEAANAYRLRRKLDGGYRLTVAENEVDFRRNNRDPAQPDLVPQLSDFDQNKDGVLTGDELTAAGLMAVLPLVDSNGDGKVSAQEFDAYYRWQGEIAGAQLILEATDEGQDLFSLLDRNGDGFLSPRELKTAADVLAAEDKDHDGYLSSSDIPYHIMLELSRGGPAAATSALLASGNSVRHPRPAKSNEPPPAWFTKMDRNGDGEISPAEFLGSREQFDRLDLNHDGLIDASEAKSAGQ